MNPRDALYVVKDIRRIIRRPSYNTFARFLSFHSTNLTAFLLNGLVPKNTVAMEQKKRFELTLCIVTTKKRYQNL